MAFKKTEPKVFVPASLADAKWINTPFAYARLAKDLTLLQQDVLLKVSDQLQDFITQFFIDKRNLLPDDPNSLFTPEATMSLPKLQINLSDFGITCNRYEEVEKAASVITQITIKAPNIEDDGTVNGFKMFPIFDEIVVPKKFNDDIESDDARKNYRVGTINASINPKVAAYAFNMRLGYINHPAQIAADAGQIYSPRIYFLIKHYLPKNKMSVSIPYDKIREDLGMNVIDPESGEKKGELYPQFSRFCYYVLDKAKEDIDRMASRNLIDITFSYTPVYKSKTNHRGNPESIEFSIELTELGKYHKLPRATRLAVAKNEEDRKRRSSRRKSVDDSAQQTIPFDDSPQPQLIAGDRVGEWQQLVTEYGEGISSELLSRALCLGTIDGAFSIQMPSREDTDLMVAAPVQDDRLKQLLVRYVGRPFRTIQVHTK